jgi:hypothetical protein
MTHALLRTLQRLLLKCCARACRFCTRGRGLADQIEPENQRYLDRVVPRAGSVALPSERIDRCAQWTALTLAFRRWRPEAGAGEYLRPEFSMRNSDGIDRHRACHVGEREANLTCARCCDCQLSARVMSMHNAWRARASAMQPEYVLYQSQCQWARSAHYRSEQKCRACSRRFSSTGRYPSSRLRTPQLRPVAQRTCGVVRTGARAIPSIAAAQSTNSMPIPAAPPTENPMSAPEQLHFPLVDSSYDNQKSFALPRSWRPV